MYKIFTSCSKKSGKSVNLYMFVNRYSYVYYVNIVDVKYFLKSININLYLVVLLQIYVKLIIAWFALTGSVSQLERIVCARLNKFKFLARCYVTRKIVYASKMSRFSFCRCWQLPIFYMDRDVKRVTHVICLCYCSHWVWPGLLNHHMWWSNVQLTKTRKQVLHLRKCRHSVRVIGSKTTF